MLRPDNRLELETEATLAQPFSNGLRTAVLLFSSMLSACAPQGNLMTGGSDSVPASERDDTGSAEDQQKDSGEDSAGEAGDTSETGDSADIGDTGDSAEPYDPESIPDVIGTWPTEDTLVNSVEFGGALRAAQSGFEPSGLTRDADTYYTVGDDGELAVLAEDGSVLNYWDSGTSGALDAEGVAVDPSTGLVYIADEATTSVSEFDPNSMSLTGENCSFADLYTDIGNGLGMEGLTFVPAEYAPSTWAADVQGYFVAGSQYVTGLNVYPASECVDGASLTSIASLPTSNTDVSGIAFNENTRRIYALHDGANTLDLIKLDGTVLATYALPAVDSGVDEQQEGLWVQATDCENGLGTLVIAYDNTRDITNNQIRAFGDFPITCR